MATQFALFDEPMTDETIDLPGADLRFVPRLFGPEAAERLFGELMATCAWKQHEVTMWGRRVAVPRLSAWYGERRPNDSYASLNLRPRPWTDPLEEVLAAVEAETGMPFNSVLANLYRDGRDSVAWHQDDETELGARPAIASVSFGATRPFHLRRVDDHAVVHSIPLTPGSLLLMAGDTQHHWEHKIAKTARPIGPRINLTFRQIVRG